MYAKNAWKKYLNTPKFDDLMNFNEEYKDYITYGKTERLCVELTEKYAIDNGYILLDDLIKNKTLINPGDKIYTTNMDKNIILYKIGKKPLTDGLRILGAHIDSPRIDIKQNPLYESEGFAYLDTHYYGGIKKYHWLTIPLSLIGVFIKKDGSRVNVSIGEKENDPVFFISDLLPHLGADQMSKPASKIVDGENLDLIFGSIPLNEKERQAAKANVLNILKDMYNITEEDFVSAELELVPTGKARDAGLDKSMVTGYGHDDRVCAFTSLKAILDLNETPEYTSCCILVDKEEVGSNGASGAHSVYFENTILELLNLTGDSSILSLRRTLQNSKALSSDVSAAYDPMFKSVYEKKNTAHLGNGLCFNKYTGVRGKSGCSDANAEYMAWLRNILDSNDINYQTAELGKVDQGGGGTIAFILANYNMEVIDAGVAVLNMHAPWEVVSKVDVYEAYLAYKVFLKN